MTRFAVCLLVAGLIPALVAPTPAPADDGIFSPFLSEEDARELGEKQHPRILKTFGGGYDDGGLAHYVGRVGAGLVLAAGEKPENYTFTVLDTPIVNAMALPGGYIYITRGLLALCDDEAEMAGILAHEIAHVTHRHVSERVNRGIFARIGVGLLGAVTDSSAAQQLAGLGAQAVLRGYSRDQESEADRAAITTLAGAGYDTAAMAGFLKTLRAHSRLKAREQGRDPDAVDSFNIMATHPRTVERVEAARAAVAAEPGTPRRERDAFLERVDGLVYGNNVDQGVVRDRRFLHPAGRFAFRVPEGFRVRNTPDAVKAQGPEGGLIVFDGARVARGRDLTTYIARDWMTGVDLARVDPLTVNDMPAATGAGRLRTRRGPYDARGVAIRFRKQQVYRFLFLSPEDRTAALNRPFRRATYSFRRLSAREARAIEPWRVRVVTVETGDTVKSLAREQPFDRLVVPRFRVLNGLDKGAALEAGRKVKVVAAE